MTRNLYLEFGPDVADRLASLTERYGERSAVATVSRALGLLEAVAPYLHDGMLTVVDPKAIDDPNVEPEVDLVFDTVPIRPEAQRAA